jgi:hypothetical protein
MPVDTFIALVTEGQPSAPAYFGHDASLNRQARPPADEERVPPTLTLDELDRAVAAERGSSTPVRRTSSRTGTGPDRST